MSTAFFIIQFFYWLSLSAWLGAVAFIAMAIPVIFRTVRENDPTLPTVLSVNLDGAHASLLATTIIVNLLATLVRVELACAGVLLLTILGQWATLGSSHLPISVVRTCLFALAVAGALYDWRLVSPRIAKYRSEYIENADDPELAKAAREQFERHYRESLTVLLLLLIVLSLLVLFSGMISNAQTFEIR